jgi:hypothetical protein
LAALQRCHRPPQHPALLVSAALLLVRMPAAAWKPSRAFSSPARLTPLRHHHQQEEEQQGRRRHLDRVDLRQDRLLRHRCRRRCRRRLAGCRLQLTVRH